MVSALKWNLQSQMNSCDWTINNATVNVCCWSASQYYASEKFNGNSVCTLSAVPCQTLWYLTLLTPKFFMNFGSRCMYAGKKCYQKRKGFRCFHGYLDIGNAELVILWSNRSLFWIPNIITNGDIPGNMRLDVAHVPAVHWVGWPEWMTARILFAQSHVFDVFRKILHKFGLIKFVFFSC